MLQPGRTASATLRSRRDRSTSGRVCAFSSVQRSLRAPAAALEPGSGMVDSISTAPKQKPAAAMLAALVLLSSSGSSMTSLAPPAAAAAIAPQTWTGPARVVDGDTLYIGEQKFRLYGVDAPEKAQTCSDAKGQTYACGLVAKDRLAQKIGSQTVSCTRRNQDQYGREVAVCSLVGGSGLLGSGSAPEDLNKWLVDNGLAVAYREYGKDYIAAEEAARAAQRGVWAGAFEYPAKWRKEEKAGLQHPPLSMPLAYQPPPLPPSSRPAPAPAPMQQVSSAPAPPASVAAALPDLCGKGVLPIKGNINSKGTKIYHLPGGPYYDKVLVEPEKGESYFCSEADAAKAGYRAVASAVRTAQSVPPS